jgi:peptidoglycan hydrolase-like protein with peptidoglycan-binding domain
MIGVAINALFLQSATLAPSRSSTERQPTRAPADRLRKTDAIAGDRLARPSPGTVSREHTVHIARFAPDPAHIDRAFSPAPAAPSSTTIAAIQRELGARGYGPLSGDGIVDLGTRAAILAYEHDHGIASTGEPSEALLQRILFGAPTGSTQNAQPAGPSPQAEETVRFVQRWLVALGYPVGRIDGRLGEDTAKAIRDFELDKGQVPKGRISAELVARLREAATSGQPRR